MKIDSDLFQAEGDDRLVRQKKAILKKNGFFGNY